VSAIPILPGAEGQCRSDGTAAGLVSHGGATTAVVTAVLLYRVIGAWGLVPLRLGDLWSENPKRHERTTRSRVSLTLAATL